MCRVASILALLLSSACPLVAPGPDAGRSDDDAGADDAGDHDAGPRDGGVADAGDADAGDPDAGADDDAGASDGGDSDAGASDGGDSDAGDAPQDAGCGVEGPAVPCPDCDAAAGTVVDLGAFQSPTAPEGPFSRVDGARRLLFSDSPETPSTSGLLASAELPAGPARVVLYHVNGAAVPKKASIVVVNDTDEALTAHLEAFTVPTPSTQYLAQGQAAVRSFLGADNATDKSVPPHGAALLLVQSLDGVSVAPGELIHAIVDVSLSGPAGVRVVFLDAATDTLSAWSTLPALERDGHDRGTFAGADRLLEVQGCAWPAGTQRLRVGADTSLLPDPRGVDELSGAAEQLAGHYGTRVAVSFPAAATTRALVLVPRAGSYAGAARLALPGTNGVLVDLPVLSDNSHGVLIGRLPAGSAGVVELIPTGGGNLPVDLVAIELP